MNKLSREFYDRDASMVATELLGKLLVHEIGGRKIAAKIVETEAYRGVEDKAAHSYGGRRTPRVEIMYGEPGFSYIYLVYGLHYCFNIVTGAAGNPQAVLIRAVEPLGELELLSQNRFNRSYDQLSASQKTGLTNGPGKLCRALSIDRSLNGEDLCGHRLYVTEGASEKFNIVAAKRVGIDYAEEAKDFLWRSYIEGNQYVSVR